MYKAKIKNLEEMHRTLNKQIDDIERNHPHVEVEKLADLKKKKLSIKDEISRLNKLQWDHDHDRVDLGD
jgi:hypothetical protein